METYKRAIGYVATLAFVLLVVVVLAAPGWIARPFALNETLGVVLFAAVNLAFVAFWAWMIADHLAHGQMEMNGLVTFLLVFMGLPAAIVYFLSVVAPRVED